MAGGRIVARVLDDAFAHSEGEIEPPICSGTVFEPGDNAQCMQIVIELQAVRSERMVQCLLAGMPKGRVANIVRQRQSLCEIDVESESPGESTGRLCDFKGMREPRAEVVTRGESRNTGENLCLPRQTPKGAGMKNPSAVPGKGCAIGVRRLRPGPLRQDGRRLH